MAVVARETRLCLVVINKILQTFKPLSKHYFYWKFSWTCLNVLTIVYRVIGSIQKLRRNATLPIILCYQNIFVHFFKNNMLNIFFQSIFLPGYCQTFQIHCMHS